MIKSIIVSGFGARRPDFKIDIPPEGIILDRNSDPKEWLDFPEKIVSNLLWIKELWVDLMGWCYRDYGSIKEDQIGDIEFNFDFSGSQYRYLLSFVQGSLYSESLSINREIVFFRLNDNPKFIINYKLLEKDKESYEQGCGNFDVPIIKFLEIGKEIKDELENMIIFDEDIISLSSGFSLESSQGFKSFIISLTNLGMDKEKIVGEIRRMICELLGENYNISKDLEFFLTNGEEEFQINFSNLSSGTRYLCYLYPLLLFAHYKKSLFVCNNLDLHLHTLVSKNLLNRFKDVQMITRLSHTDVS